ncbi:hypothetical protein LSH36_354g00015 [Paralvinella palmiformis]|uniref:Apple domain-containing protein n=1 Tax=Paralvinella palmiformis TaxID=53620 RepID=A0AAD9JFI7_9ANNE|nr:hypothetical protein LSH36_354g00015 [Paralvinella palmiformis]
MLTRSSAWSEIMAGYIKLYCLVNQMYPVYEIITDDIQRCPLRLISHYHVASKLEFHRIIGKRAEGDIKYDQNGTSIDQCLRLCRLMTDCYRVNYYGSDIGRCQIIVRYIGLTDMADWSYYVTCPEGMIYHYLTGSCYGLMSKMKFHQGVEYCTRWAPGVHIADIDSDSEDDICTSFLTETGGLSISIGARRPPDNDSVDGFYWITTGERLTYDDDDDDDIDDNDDIDHHHHDVDDYDVDDDDDDDDDDDEN